MKDKFTKNLIEHYTGTDTGEQLMKMFGRPAKPVKKQDDRVHKLIDRHFKLADHHPEYFELWQLEDMLSGSIDLTITLVERCWNMNREHEAKGIYERNKLRASDFKDDLGK